ncbi:hypothetical protein IAR50_000925 [Cryptococcus sp. DSM 104548]
MTDSTTTASSQPEEWVIPTGTLYRSIGVNNEPAHVQPGEIETITLNTGIDWELPPWKGSHDGSDVWDEPSIRNRWVTHLPPLSPNTEHPRTGQSKADLANVMSSIKEVYSQAGKDDDIPFSDMYEATKDEVDNLYGERLEILDEELCRALSFAACHMSKEGHKTTRTYTDDDVQQITSKLSRAHLSSVLEDQQQTENYMQMRTPKDLGIRPYPREAVETMRGRVTRLSEALRDSMDKTLLGGGTMSLVWDDKGGRMRFVTNDMLEPLPGFTDEYGTAIPTPGPLVPIDEELQSWVVFNSRGVVSYEDGNGKQFDLGS